MNKKRRASVLVVEDDKTTQFLLNSILASENDVTVASDGEVALAIAADINPDLILLDIVLGELDGLEVCRRFKADSRTSDIPIIFLTHKSTDEDEINGLEAGGVDYIAKPINALLVRTRVRIHLELKFHRDNLTQMARIDGLTGVANRRAFDDMLDREWRRLGRARESLGVIMMDVDHFKQYNDTYGHGAGDACLQQVSKAAVGALQRPADMVARYGGEEFVVLLPATTLEGALGVAEGIRTAISHLGLPHKGSMSANHVTVSLGVACMVPEIDQAPKTLLEAADTQLYAAKAGGRNRAVGKDMRLPVLSGVP